MLFRLPSGASPHAREDVLRHPLVRAHLGSPAPKGHRLLDHGARRCLR